VSEIANLDAHPSRVLAALTPASAISCLSALGGTITKPEAFSLSRRKGGAQVWLHCGRLTVNLNLQLKHEPASFADAREWIGTLERRFGIELPERPRRKLGRARLRLLPGPSKAAADHAPQRSASLPKESGGAADGSER